MSMGGRITGVVLALASVHCGNIIHLEPTPDDAGSDDARATEGGPVGSLNDASGVIAPDGGGAPDAERYFIDNVYPSLEPTCSMGGGCHGPGATAALQFFGNDAEGSYQLFKQHGFDKSTTFVTRGSHAGPVLTSNQIQIFQTWQGMEH